jgi:hypothetical protein
VPKRSEERRRRNKDSAVDIAAAGAQTQAPALRPGLHPLAAAWYQSLSASGQSRFYEPSDWMTAQVIAEGIDSFAREPRASLLSTILSGSANLMVTEGDRRRLRLELVRAEQEASSVRPATAATRNVRRLKAVDGGR